MMMDERRRLLEDTCSAKAEAERLLAELLTCGASGRADCADLFKKVSGQSSLEKAVEDTRRVIASHERLLAQIEKDEGLAFVGPSVLAPRSVAYQAMAGR